VLDVFAMRVVIGVKDEFQYDNKVQAEVCRQAYAAARSALETWREPKGRFKDYVTKPKPNGYASIHTTLEHPSGLPLEMQIRTEEMHQAAEFGDAAHSLYKGGIKSLAAAQQFANTVALPPSRPNFRPTACSTVASRPMARRSSGAISW